MPFGVIGALLVIALVLCGLFALFTAIWSAAAALAIFFFIVCVLMMLVILIQRPKGGGLAGAFGGVGGGQQSAFGAKVGDVLTWVTVGFFVAFLFLAMGLTWHIKAEQEVQIPAPSVSSTESQGDSGATSDSTGQIVSETPSPSEGDDTAAP